MKLQNFLGEAGKNACLAIDYVWVVADYFGVDEKAKDSLIIQTLRDNYDTDVLDSQFYVMNPIALMQSAIKLMGLDPKDYFLAVTKDDIKSYKDLPNGYVIVRHDLGDTSHFVVAKDKVRVYDSLDDSVCVKNGKPTKARIVEIDCANSEKQAA